LDEIKSKIAFVLLSIMLVFVANYIPHNILSIILFGISALLVVSFLLKIKLNINSPLFYLVVLNISVLRANFYVWHSAISDADVNLSVFLIIAVYAINFVSLFVSLNYLFLVKIRLIKIPS